MTFSSYDYKDIYPELGIEIPKLGCVMLDVENIHVADYLDFPEDDLYASQNPSRYWIKGDVASTGAHVTLLYGLLERASNWRGQIDRVLEGWKMPLVEIEKVDFFDSTFEDDPYYCIIGHVKVTPEFLDARQRLSLLPHIDTYNEYRPHITLAYVKKDERVRNKWINELGYWLNGRQFQPLNLNYGK